MDDVADLLDGYPFDVLLGSVHWLGTWRFDVLSDPQVLAEWDHRDIDAVWEEYTRAMEELGASGVCDVFAHPDLVKIAGRRPAVPDEFYDRITEAAVASGMAAEVSSAGWRKPVGEEYPAPPLLRRFVDRGVPLTTASDAHTLPDVAERADDLRTLLDRCRGVVAPGLPQTGSPTRSPWTGTDVGRAQRPQTRPTRGGLTGGHPRRTGLRAHQPRRGAAGPPPTPARHVGHPGRPVVLRPGADGPDGPRAHRPPSRRPRAGDPRARCDRRTAPRWSSTTWWARRSTPTSGPWWSSRSRPASRRGARCSSSRVASPSGCTASPCATRGRRWPS